jgi:hypothetical protein
MIANTKDVNIILINPFEINSIFPPDLIIINVVIIIIIPKIIRLVLSFLNQLGTFNPNDIFFKKFPKNAPLGQ